jgi:hypothetical protein
LIMVSELTSQVARASRQHRIRNIRPFRSLSVFRQSSLY